MALLGNRSTSEQATNRPSSSGSQSPQINMIGEGTVVEGEGGDESETVKDPE